MKKTALIIALLMMITACAIKPTENRIEKTLAIKEDSVFVREALMMIDDVESSELKYQLTERLFPLVIDREEEIYQSVLNATQESHNAMQYAMLANTIAWKNRENTLLEDRLFSLIEDAAVQCRTGEFIDALSVYLDKRGYSPMEKIEAEPQYRAMILDTYAYYLMKMGRVEDALAVYEEILAEYDDPEILINVSRAQAKLNRYQFAMENVLKALSQAPAHQDALSLIYEYGESLSYPASAIDTMVEKAVNDAHEAIVSTLDEIRIDKPMPAFKLENLDGSVVRSSDLQGKILVIDFFATWCGPCRRELPKVHQLYQSYKNDEDIHFLIVSTDKDKSKVRPFIEANQYTFPVYYGNGVSEKFGIKGVPTLFVVGPNGKIRYEKIGYAEGEDLEFTVMMYVNSLR
jgi:thiol-disulfide isomerase/thioredoxin